MPPTPEKGTDAVKTFNILACGITAKLLPDKKFKGGAEAAILVCVPLMSGLDSTIPLYEQDISTNRLEIQAAIRALEEAAVVSANVLERQRALALPLDRLEMVSMRIASYHVTAEVIPNLELWTNRGFKNGKGKPIANLDLVQYLSKLVLGMRAFGLNPYFTTWADPVPISHPARLIFAPLNPYAWAMSRYASQPICCRGWMFKELRFFEAVELEGMKPHCEDRKLPEDHVPCHELYAIGVGTVLLDVELENNSKARLFIRHVLLVPRLETNILPFNYQPFVTKEGSSEVAQKGTAAPITDNKKRFDPVKGTLRGKGSKKSKGEEIGFAPLVDGINVLVQDKVSYGIWPASSPQMRKREPMIHVWVEGTEPEGKGEYRVVVDGVPDDQL